MKKHKQISILVCIGFSNLVMVGCLLFSNRMPRTNSSAPDFMLSSLGGRKVQLSNFQGKPVLVNFWATWCQPCIQEIPIIQSRFERHYPNLVVLAIEEGSSTKEIAQVAHNAETTFLILKGTDEVLSQYGITAYPTSYFIDEKGIIQTIIVGSMDASTIDRALSNLGLETK